MIKKILVASVVCAGLSACYYPPAPQFPGGQGEVQCVQAPCPGK